MHLGIRDEKKGRGNVKKKLAMVLSAVMVFSLCLCPAAFADTVRYEDAGDVEISGDKVDTMVVASGDTDLTINGDVSAETGEAEKQEMQSVTLPPVVVVTDGADVTVNGNLTNTNNGGGPQAVSSGEGGQAISVTGEDSTGHVTGDVTGIAGAGDGGTLTIDGDVNGLVGTNTAPENQPEYTAVSVGGDVNGSVMAFENGVSVEGDVTGAVTQNGIRAGVNAQDQANVDVGGDVENGVYADHAEVSVGGDIPGAAGQYMGASNDRDRRGVEGSVIALNESTVDVGGSTGSNVIARENSEVDIAGNVEGNVSSYSGSTVTVGGNVNSEGSGINALGGDITVNGNVSGNDVGAVAGYGGSIEIGGDLNSSRDGIVIVLSDPAPESIIVKGTISAEGDAIVLDGANYNGGTLSNADEVLALVPEIVVQTLNPGDDFVSVNAVGTVSAADQEAIVETVLSQIYYLVNTDQIDAGSISLIGYEVIHDNLQVAQENTILTLKATDDGYVLANVSAGKYASITENPDGTYTILVNRGGDLRLSASTQARVNPPEQEAGADPAPAPAAQVRAVPANQAAGFKPTALPGALVGQEVKENGEAAMTMDLITNSQIVFVRSTIERFAAQGNTVLVFKTANGNFEIPIAQLLELVENSVNYRFVVNGDLLEIWVDGEQVMTLSMQSGT